MIAPLTSNSPIVSSRSRPADSKVFHIWKERFFRLFLSHVSAHKAAVSSLQTELRLRGISAFVAHKDITPSLEWQHEIELALDSMHSLAALLTPDFHRSDWTDQEVGFAWGNGVLVVPVRLGLDPYGSIGKVQGFKASLDQPSKVARVLADTLLKNEDTREQMRTSIVSAFAVADSYSNSIALSKLIATMDDFTTDEEKSLQLACKENDQVYNANGVVYRVFDALGLTLPPKETAEDEFLF